MTLTLSKMPEGLNVRMNYEFNLLHHVGVVAKRLRARGGGRYGGGARRGRQYLFGPNGLRGKNDNVHDQQDK